jgi:hypothetical protein
VAPTIDTAAVLLYPTFKRTGSDPREYRVGFMNKQGLQVVEPLFEDARPFENGFASVKNNGRWGAIDGQLRLRIESLSDRPLRISEDRAVFEFDGRRGVVDLNGQIIVEPKYRTIGGFHEGASWMSLNGSYGFIWPDGKELIAPFYEDARSFSEGVAPVKLGGKWGFVNKTLDFEIPLQFEFALPFSEGLARVKQNNVWGYIDNRGRFAIAPRYAEARAISITKEVSSSHPPTAMRESSGRD